MFSLKKKDNLEKKNDMDFNLLVLDLTISPSEHQINININYWICKAGIMIMFYQKYVYWVLKNKVCEIYKLESVILTLWPRILQARCLTQISIA